MTTTATAKRPLSEARKGDVVIHYSADGKLIAAGRVTEVTPREIIADRGNYGFDKRYSKKTGKKFAGKGEYIELATPEEVASAKTYIQRLKKEELEAASIQQRERRRQTFAVELKPADDNWNDLVLSTTTNGYQYQSIGLTESEIDKVLAALQDHVAKRKGA